MNSVINQPAVKESKNTEKMLAPLNEESIREHLKEQGLEAIKDVHVFASVTSTNDFLLENDKIGHQLTVCVAEQQTQGRGRYGHQWVSPAAANLYLSMSLPLHLPKQASDTDQLDALSLWLLIALAKVIEQEGCAAVQLKWPNDICVQNKKLAGVLIERKIGPARNKIVIGVGVNIAMSLNEEVEIETPWIDLLTACPNWQLTRNELAAKVVAVFYETLQDYENMQLRGLASIWNSYDMLLNKNVTFLHDGQDKSGRVNGVDDLGRIIMDIKGKPEHLHASHISEIKPIGNTK